MKDLKISSQPTPGMQNDDPEVKTKTTLQTLVSNTVDWNDRLSHCASWSTAIRAVARIVRLARRSKTKGQLSVAELSNAECLIIKGLQMQAFPNERKCLVTNSALPKTSRLYQLDPFLQDDVIRVGGRLEKASMPLSEKHPTVLPSKSHITNLIIDHFHKKTKHQGRGITLNEIHSNGYWISGGSTVVTQYINKCVTCRKVRRPLETQRMADLPKERVDSSPPFSYTGMDCFGPFTTKNGRKETKRYGLLFTCYCSRAIHLEMIDDLSTDAFINGLRCFIAVRGTVRHLRSDQGTNFIGAKNMFQNALKEFDTNRLQHFLAAQQCEFDLQHAKRQPHRRSVGKTD